VVGLSASEQLGGGDLRLSQAAAEAIPAQDVPLVSVVVPVLDGEATVRESLESILGQRYPRLELIVMDDGSTDATAEIVASFGDRVSYRRQPSRRGIYGNANDGIALASGEFVGVFHADDVYLPDLVSREVAWLRAHPEAGAVFCLDVFVDADGREIGRLELLPELRGDRPLPYPVVLNALLRHKNVFLRCPTALVRADVYRELGGYRDAEFANTSDMEMWLRIARSHPIGVLEEHLMHYRRGHGSSSERYGQLRTEPHRFFQIMDLELAGPGRDVSEPDALAAYEAHRADEMLMCSVSAYILGDVRSARTSAAKARLGALMRGRRRTRTVPLVLLLRVVTRLPRLRAVAHLFSRRWHRGSRTKVAV
jgi:GT2 family glycosyltransferase